MARQIKRLRNAAIYVRDTEHTAGMIVVWKGDNGNWCAEVFMNGGSQEILESPHRDVTIVKAECCLIDAQNQRDDEEACSHG